MGKNKRSVVQICCLCLFFLGLVHSLSNNNQSLAQTAKRPIIQGVPACGSSSLSINGATPGNPITKVAPAYPDKAKRKKINGAVVVEVLIDEAGNVRTARVLSGHKLLRDSASTAAREWKFAPTLLDGKPGKGISTRSEE